MISNKYLLPFDYDEKYTQETVDAYIQDIVFIKSLQHVKKTPIVFVQIGNTVNSYLPNILTKFLVGQNIPYYYVLFDPVKPFFCENKIKVLQTHDWSTLFLNLPYFNFHENVSYIFIWGDRVCDIQTFVKEFKFHFSILINTDFQDKEYVREQFKFIIPTIDKEGCYYLSFNPFINLYKKKSDIDPMYNKNCNIWNKKLLYKNIIKNFVYREDYDMLLTTMVYNRILEIIFITNPIINIMGYSEKHGFYTNNTTDAIFKYELVTSI